MKSDPNAPVIVGVAEALRRPAEGLAPDQLTSPAEMTADALRAAAEDAGAGEGILRRAGLIAMTPSIAWPAGDAPAQVGALLGLKARTMRSAFQGGNGPQLLVNEVAARIAAGEVDVALVGGAEAMQSGLHAAREGFELAWPAADIAAPSDDVLDAEHAGHAANTEAEVAVGVIAPITAYPLIENAIWRRSGASAAEHLDRIAGLWSRFSQVAASNPCAWTPTAMSPEQIAAAGGDNRLVTFPYRKLMNANIQVDQAAGLVLCAAHVADELGIDEHRRVYVHAGAQGTDEWFLSERAELDRSPAIRECGRAAFVHAGIGPDDLGVIDLYSCFPSAVELAAAELGLPLDDAERPLTTTGGLTFFGGPGNNYAMHGIAGVVRGLRAAKPGARGLASALGWYATKHAIGVYGNEPPASRYELFDVQPAIDGSASPREVAEPYDGTATAETCTVIYERDGSPSYGVLFALDERGRRVLCRTSDPELTAVMAADGFLGSPVAVRGDRTFSLA